jgi:hypothetical protein
MKQMMGELKEKQVHAKQDEKEVVSNTRAN